MALHQLWKSNIFSKTTKVRIFKSNVRPVLLYGSECWRMTKNDIQKCETFQNKCLKRIMKIFWPERKRKKGRPKETWRRMAEKELKEMGWKTWEAAARVAADRQQWNDMCSALCSTRSEEDNLFIWGFTSLSTLYRSYHDG